MPHIAQLSQLVNWGGLERLMLDFLFEPGKMNRYSLITTSSKRDLIRLIKEHGVNWFQPEYKLRYDFRKITAIANYIESQQIDLVHSYNAHGNSWANLALLLTHNSLPLITGEHGSIWFVMPPMRWLDQLAQKKASMVIANSHASALMLQKIYGIPTSKIRVVYNGVEIPVRLTKKEARAKLKIPQNVQVVGSVGRLDTPKDFGTLVKAAKLVNQRKPNVLFVVIGNGPQEEYLRKLVTQTGIENVFLFIGLRTDARELIAAFDLYVSTSIREAFGNTLIEAALLEKPVIAPNIDGIPEAVINNETGVLLPPTEPVTPIHINGATPMAMKVMHNRILQVPKSLSPYSLAQTIIALLDSPNLCQELGSKGRERAERLFSVHRYVMDLERAYSDVLDSSRGGSI